MTNDYTTYIDYPIYKKISKNGELKTIIDSDALAQAIQIWLVSEQNEKMRSRSGGVLSPYLGKLMDEDVAKDIKVRIRQQLKDEFKPPIEVVSLEVIPIKEKNLWYIELAGYNSDLGVGVNTNMTIINI